MWQKKYSVYLSPRLKFGVGRGYSTNKIYRAAGGLCLILTLALLTRTIWSWSKSETGAMPAVLGAVDVNNSPSLPLESITYDYTVQPGDTLFNISQRLHTNVPWTTLAELNNLKPPFSLKSGQIIKIPNTK
jgi:LysM repeat protein